MDNLQRLIPVAAILLTLWQFLSNRKAKTEERMKKLEFDNANYLERLTGFSQQVERNQDAAENRFRAMENQLGEVGRLREDMVGVKAEMRHVVEGYNKLEAKLDKLFDLLRPHK